MATFPPNVVDDLLIKCRRRCCICLRFRGRNLEIHHIDPQAAGGSGDADNGIPVCYDCHAEIESKSNMGRKFSAGELRGHRNAWFAIVREHPERLDTSQGSETSSGPLEALLAEMEFNYTIICEAVASSMVPLNVRQFERAIGANALRSLPDDASRHVQKAYVEILRINQFLDRLLHLRAAASDYQATEGAMKKTAESLHINALPDAIVSLEVALGRYEGTIPSA